MAICGFEFPDQSVCGQKHGHTHPHLKWDEGHEYHQKRFYYENIIQKTLPDSWAHNLAKLRLGELDQRARKEYE